MILFVIYLIDFWEELEFEININKFQFIYLKLFIKYLLNFIYNIYCILIKRLNKFYFIELCLLGVDK